MISDFMDHELLWVEQGQQENVIPEKSWSFFPEKKKKNQLASRQSFHESLLLTAMRDQLVSEHCLLKTTRNLGRFFTNKQTNKKTDGNVLTRQQGLEESISKKKKV